MPRSIGPASGTGACTFPPLANAHGPEDAPQIGGSPPPRGTARRTGSKAAFMTEASFGDHPRIRKPRVRAPETCIPQGSTQSQNTTKLLQKCRKNNEWQQALEAKREEFARRMTECDARQAELKKRCKSLRKRVQQNEQGVQETRSKIDRATKKQEEERILQQDKALEIKQKKLQVASEEDEYAKMIKDLERTNQYKQFLDVVCEENEGHFDEVDRILMRHESLFESQQQQSEKLLEHSDYVERRRDEFAKFCKSSGTEVVERNATIAQDRKTLDVLISETKELLIADEKIKQKQQKGIMELGEIEMAVDNLYTRCFIMDQELTKAQAQEIDRVLKLPRDAKTVQMLDRLCVFYLDMEHIAREARNHPAKPAAVAAADDPKQSPKREKKGHETTDIRQTADADAASNSGHANSAATPGTTQEVRVSAVSDATVRGVEV